MIACMLPSPPATTIRRDPARCRTPSSSPGSDVDSTSTEVSARRIRSAHSRRSASLVPASAFAMTRRGSGMRVI